MEMTRNDYVADQAQTLKRIRVLERQIARRRPRVEKSQADYKREREELLRKFDEKFKQSTAKISSEMGEFEKKLAMEKKRFSELSDSILRASDATKPSQS